MIKHLLSVAIAAVVAVLALPAASAHPAAPALEYEVRLLADCVDDYFGGDVGGSGSHDVIALDLREGHDAMLGDYLAFELMVNGGSPDAAAPITDEVTFTAGGEARAFSFRTQDNAAFTGTFDRVVGPEAALAADGSEDGTRQVVSGLVSLTTLGLGPGDAIADFAVESASGTTRGDFMPGTFETLGVEAPSNACTAEGGAPSERPGYDVRGPTYFVGMAAGETAQGHGNVTVPVTVSNLLEDFEQSVTITLPDSDHYSASFAEDASTSLDLALPAGGSAGLDIVVSGAGTAEVTLVAVTDLGGRTVLVVPVTLPDAHHEDPVGDGHDHDHDADDNETDDKGSPGLDAAIVLAGVAAAAFIARRQS